MSSDGLFNRINSRLEADSIDDTPPTMSDILDLPEDQRSMMRHVLRSPDPLTPHEAAEGLGWDDAQAHKVVGDLSFIGMIDLVDGRMKVAPMHRNTRSTPGGMWSTLNDL